MGKSYNSGKTASPLNPSLTHIDIFGWFQKFSLNNQIANASCMIHSWPRKGHSELYRIHPITKPGIILFFLTFWQCETYHKSVFSTEGHSCSYNSTRITKFRGQKEVLERTPPMLPPSRYKEGQEMMMFAWAEQILQLTHRDFTLIFSIAISALQWLSTSRAQK